MSRSQWVLISMIVLMSASVLGQAQQPDWKAFEDETMRHYQALLRFETMDPPGNEKPAADYLQQVLEKEGIQTQVFSLDPKRPNVVARFKGNGTKRPLLIMSLTPVSCPASSMFPQVVMPWLSILVFSKKICTPLKSMERMSAS